MKLKKLNRLLPCLRVYTNINVSEEVIAYGYDKGSIFLIFLKYIQYIIFFLQFCIANLHVVVSDWAKMNSA